MVLVKMLMEIDPISMRGSMVMTMVTISPSRRDISPAEQLRRSPRLVLPRFRLETAALRTESFLINFFQGKRHHIAEDGHRRTARGPTRQGRAQGVGRNPTLVARVWAPYGGFFRRYFLLIPKITYVKFQDFWSCAE